MVSMLEGLLKPLLQKPNGQLQAGLLWVGKLTDYRVELHWPSGVQGIPSPDAVEVRAFSAHYGWFGFTVDEILSKPEVSADRHTWIYKGGDPTEMVAVFHEGAMSALPSIRVISPKQGTWKRMDVEISGGFRRERRRRTMTEVGDPCGNEWSGDAFGGGQGDEGDRRQPVAIAGRGRRETRHHRAAAVHPQRSASLG